jgi:hypothetical protein
VARVCLTNLGIIVVVLFHAKDYDAGLHFERPTIRAERKMVGV